MNKPENVPPATQVGQVMRVKRSLITRSPHNPRTHFAEDKLAELAASMKVPGADGQPRGNMVPILVRPIELDPQGAVNKALKLKDVPQYELVDGERRLRAAESIRLEELNCVVMTLTRAQARELQLLSFVREEISDLEAARSYQELIEKHGFTAETLRDKLGLAKSTFYGRMSVLRAHPAVLKALADQKISQSHVQLLTSLPDSGAQADLLKTVLQSELSVRDTKATIERDYVRDLEKAPFDGRAVTPDGVECAHCIHRGANAKDRFPQLALLPEGFTARVAVGQLLLQLRKDEVIQFAATQRSDRPMATLYSRGVKWKVVAP